MAGIEAMVLAAGASRRLGAPKALLRFDGRTALELIGDVIRAAGVERGVVVVGEHAGELAAAVDPAPLVWRRNPDPDAGRTGSVQIGLDAVAAGADVLLWPADRPLASADTVGALVAASGDATADAGIVVPEHGGARGHPVLLRAALLPALRAARPDAILRDVIRASGLGRRTVAVDDPGIHFDLDTPDAYERALAWWREARSGSR